VNYKIQEMKDLYDKGLSLKQIAKIFGYKTGKSISDKFKKHNIPTRSIKEQKALLKTYDESFLEKLDASWKGYFIGLMLTDGWINTDKTNVGLQSVDEDLISFISLCTNKNYFKYPGKNFENPTNKKIYIGKDFYRINFTSEKLYQDIQRFGIVQNKTKCIGKINLYPDEQKYIKDILRGIIDGDGTFGFPSNCPGTAYCRIVSASEFFLEQILKWFLILGFENLKVKPVSGQVDLWQIEICGFENLQLVKYCIYKNPYGLKRKRNKLLEAAYPSDWDRKTSYMRETP